MSQDWSAEELKMASASMEAEGYMSFEQFCDAIGGGDAQNAACQRHKTSCNCTSPGRAGTHTPDT